MTQFYQINCRTHLHAGSGDSNYGVIDNMVQRDPANELPCIFASSLKGAFREYFKEMHGEELTSTIFGSSDSGKSKVIFHQALLLSIPVRSNQYPYFNLLSPMVIEELADTLLLLDKEKYAGLIEALNKLKSKAVSKKAVIFGISKKHLKIEDFEEADIDVSDFALNEDIAFLFGQRMVMVDDASFKDLTSDYRLPVIARNNLENGQSINLWYEQILPRASKFFFAVSTVANEECPAFFKEFEEDKNIQIGANATIGYGLCKISKI